ncbi:MFS transporter [Sulfurospirillum arcachonense]|uniref:MFS transporter n=1 Tax=Sulfurospirillum arcachonense TaxID=57666 RepID=UPI000469883E|nr:MFS transporter [Sulfurospirillum arcachonense]
MLFFKISAFFFSYFSVTAVYVIFMPKILQMIGYSSLQIGVVFALAPLMRFLVPFLFLKHIELNKKVFYISLISVFLSSLLFYITIKNFYLFMIPNLIIGASLGLVLPYIETYAMGHLQKGNFGKCRMFGSFGFMITGILLAKDLDSYIIGLNYYLFFVITVLLFGFWITHNNEDFKQKEKNPDEEKFDLKKVTYLWVSLFFMQISFGAFYNFFTIYETERGISLEMTSYLWAFGVICEIVFFYFQGPLLQKNLLSVLKFSVFLTILRWLILFLFPQSLVMSFVSQSFHAVSFALHHTAAISLLYSIYQNKKLSAQFYYGFSFGLGGFVGALLAGYFYGDYLYLYASFMALLSFLALFKVKKTNLI